MDFLLLAVLVAWSLGTCFLPVRERTLRIMVMINAMLVSLALTALVVPVFQGSTVTVLEDLFAVDTLRALLAIPVAVSWVAGTAAFVMWWGVSFSTGGGTRPLFCWRSATLVGAFAGILLMLLTDSLPVMLGGLLLTFLMVCVGVLFQVKENVLPHVRKFAVGCGAALMMLVAGVGMLLVSGYEQTGTLFMTGDALRIATLSSTSQLSMLGIVTTGFGALWFMGLVPFMAWYRKGMANLPRGHRLVMRVLLPVTLFPHLLTLAAWGGSAGSVFVEKMLLVLSVFAGLTTFEYLRTKEGIGEAMTVFLLTLTLVTMAYGPAGAIPALMIVMMLALGGTALMLSQGAIAWPRKARMYAALVLGGVPGVSPLFVPYALSVGYGIQMMPGVALVTAVFMCAVTFTLVTRTARAWSEDERTYADVWGARFAAVLLVLMTLYGGWFLYTDALALMVKSVGI